MWTVLHTLVSLPLAFGANLVIARVLGVADYGRLAFLTALMQVAAGLVAVGLNPALLQFGAKAHAAGRTDDVRRLLSATQGFRLMVAAPLLTLLLVAVARVDPGVLLLAVLFGIWVPALIDGAAVALNLENKTATSAKIAIVVNLLVQSAIVIAVLAAGTADAVWATRLAVGGAAYALVFPAVAREYRRALLRPSLPRGLPEGFWRFAIPVGVSGFVATLVLSRTEVFFLQAMSEAPEVGLFALAFGLASHVFAPAQALVGPLIPAVSALREVDSASVSRAFERTLRATATVVALLVAVAVPPLAILVPVLYGSDFADAAAMVLALGISGGLLVAAGPVSAFVLARLSARRLLYVNLLALGVDVVLALALIPGLGAWGAVIANVSGAMTRLVLLLRGEVRMLKLAWPTTLRLLVPILLGGVAGVAAWISVTVLFDATLTRALGAAALGGSILMVTMWLLRTGLTPEDASAIERTVPQRLRGPAHGALWGFTRAPRSEAAR